MSTDRKSTPTLFQPPGLKTELEKIWEKFKKHSADSFSANFLLELEFFKDLEKLVTPLKADQSNLNKYPQLFRLLIQWEDRKNWNEKIIQQSKTGEQPTYDFNREEILKDFTGVGPEKPLGYLAKSTLDECFPDKQNLQNFLKELSQKKLLIVDVAEVYVCDTSALEKLLNLPKNKEILSLNNINPTAAEFIQYISSHNADGDTALFDLIADAFADYGNPGRLHINADKLVAPSMVMTAAASQSAAAAPDSTPASHPSGAVDSAAAQPSVRPAKR